MTASNRCGIHRRRAEFAADQAIHLHRGQPAAGGHRPAHRRRRRAGDAQPGALGRRPRQRRDVRTAARRRASTSHWSNPKFYVTHEKSIVVDGAAALVATFNLCNKYFTLTRDYGVDHPASRITSRRSSRCSTPTGNHGDWHPAVVRGAAVEQLQFAVSHGAIHRLAPSIDSTSSIRNLSTPSFWTASPRRPSAASRCTCCAAASTASANGTSSTPSPRCARCAGSA